MDDEIVLLGCLFIRCDLDHCLFIRCDLVQVFLGLFTRCDLDQFIVAAHTHNRHVEQTPWYNAYYTSLDLHFSWRSRPKPY